MDKSTRMSLVALCVFAALPAALAGAKAPPVAKYDCTIGGSTLFGTLAIKSGGKYKHRGTSGTFTTSAKKVTFSDKRKGYRIKFKGGSLSGVKGRWYRTTGDKVDEIALKNPKDGFESIYCDRNK